MNQSISIRNSGNNISDYFGILKWCKSAIVLIIFSSVFSVKAQVGWTLTNMSVAGVQMGAASLGTKVYFAGGKRGAGAVTSDLIDIYDNCMSSG